MKVLISSGGTNEKIDGVRSITNFSTGKTGGTIAAYFHKKGSEVTLLHGLNADLPQDKIEMIPYKGFFDLNDKMKKLLSACQYDAVIHAAAVSDYSIDHLKIGEKRVNPEFINKIDSSDTISIHLKNNFKILDRIKEYSVNAKMLLIGFKLTNTDSKDEMKKAIDKICSKKWVDMVVHNDLNEISDSNHVASLYGKDGYKSKSSTKMELAEKLYDYVENKMREQL